jgi:hypothetical protein
MTTTEYARPEIADMHVGVVTATGTDRYHAMVDNLDYPTRRDLFNEAGYRVGFAVRVDVHQWMAVDGSGRIVENTAGRSDRFHTSVEAVQDIVSRIR